MVLLCRKDVGGTYHCEGPAILAVDGHIISFENGNLQTPYHECQSDLGNVEDQFKERDLLRIELPSLPAHCCQSVMTSRGVWICPGCQVWRVVCFSWRHRGVALRGGWLVPRWNNGRRNKLKILRLGAPRLLLGGFRSWDDSRQVRSPG